VYGIINPFTGEEIWHPTNAWKYSIEENRRHIQENRLYWGPKGEHRYPRLKVFLGEVGGLVPTDVWTQEEAGTTDEASRILDDLFGCKVFTNPKPPKLVSKIVTIMRNDKQTNNAVALDFFAGSGTTAHAVVNLNREDGGRRKYILVEMADYFDTVILPRIKKVVFCEKWKDGKAAGGKGVSHFVKYFQLEQYEDVLCHAHYADADLFSNPYQVPYSQYVFLRDLKMLDAVQVDAQQEIVQADLSKLYAGIDLAETLSCVTGKWIRHITADYVEFADGERVDLRNPDWKLIKPLIWWGSHA